MLLRYLPMLAWLCLGIVAQAHALQPAAARDHHPLVAAAADDAGKWTADLEPDGGLPPLAPAFAPPRMEPPALTAALGVAFVRDLSRPTFRARAPPAA